jgi:putative transposase
MDGVGRALDNVYVERLWRSLKYEDIYLRSYESMMELRQGIERYFTFYNTERLLKPEVFSNESRKMTELL